MPYQNASENQILALSAIGLKTLQAKLEDPLTVTNSII